MNIDRIRQALTDELGEDGVYRFWFPYGKRIQVFKRIDGTDHSIVDATPTELAAIGRALQSAAGETMIPLAEAVRVVDEAIEVEQNGWACSPRELYALASASESITAALQALGGSKR